VIWALKDVSFEVKHGEAVGIIGRNGAGKSTVLKILSRITEPTRGRATVYGRVGSLLEVGTGFHPDLTGRENVYLNGTILGMKKREVDARFDEIVDFSGVEKFIDTPVKRYSSGMRVRLAFAVAAHLEPEILIVDEVLAVGDAEFQQKCLGKMGEVAKRGRTVLFVSHNMQTIQQLCGRAIYMAGGGIMLDGESSRVVPTYLHDVPRGESLVAVRRAITQLPPDTVFRLHDVDVRQDGESTTELLSGKPMEIICEYEVLQATPGLHVWFMVSDSDGTLLFESLHNGDAPDIPTVLPGKYVSRATIPGDFLAGRPYTLRINAAIHRVRECISVPLNLSLNVAGVGLVNRAYPGYQTPGRIAPLIHWETKLWDTEASVTGIELTPRS
jgi:lipopolysaccharide transport system ATP-binding protein